ncbi:MAG TPA: radical SAM protein [Candidatus Paceibacterota bacterium]
MERNVLDFIAKLLQPSLRDWVENYVHHRSTLGPLIVEFDPTTACNMSCPECISGLLLNQGQIALERALALIDEFHRCGVRGIIFIGGGEPLAYKGMPVPILRCREHGIAVGLTTNGTLIRRYIPVLAECVSWTRFSVDAATQETFSIFRQSNIPESFKRVTNNISALANAKRGLMGYSFLLIERLGSGGDSVTNTHEMLKAAQLARELGCDYFEVKPAVDMHHNLIPFSSSIRESLAEQWSQMKYLNVDTFRVIAPRSFSQLLTGTSPNQPKNYTRCPSLEMRTLVTPKGIYPCPYNRGREETKLGDIDVPFDSFWSSEQRSRRVADINPSTDCPFFCVRHEMNLLLLTLAQAYDGGVNLLPYMVYTETDDVFV